LEQNEYTTLSQFNFKELLYPENMMDIKLFHYFNSKLFKNVLLIRLRCFRETEKNVLLQLMWITDMSFKEAPCTEFSNFAFFSSGHSECFICTCVRQLQSPKLFSNNIPKFLISYKTHSIILIIVAKEKFDTFK